MTGICGLAARSGGAAEGLPAMLAALADYGPKAWCRRWPAAALGAVGAHDATPLMEAWGLRIAADARLDNSAELREALGLKPRRTGHPSLGRAAPCPFWRVRDQKIRARSRHFWLNWGYW